MMIEIIQLSCHSKSEKNVPRVSFLKACHDLYALYGKNFNKLSFNHATHPSFNSAIEQVNRDVIKMLTDADAILIVTTRDEFDPAYSHIGTYLQNRYDLKADMIDICDIGDNGKSVALNIAKNLELKNVSYKIIILIFD